MTKDIATFVRKCNKFQLNKHKRQTKQEMTLTPRPIKPFDIVIIDTIGPMTKTNSGNVYALTIICDLTKYVIMAPMPNKEANTIAKALFEELVSVYGAPKSIRTDSGTEYKNSIVKELCELCKLEHNFSTF